jgi:hypothetical protein
MGKTEKFLTFSKQGIGNLKQKKIFILDIKYESTWPATNTLIALRTFLYYKRVSIMAINPLKTKRICFI